LKLHDLLRLAGDERAEAAHFERERLEPPVECLKCLEHGPRFPFRHDGLPRAPTFCAAECRVLVSP
jgi:hypothetical protein